MKLAAIPFGYITRMMSTVRYRGRAEYRRDGNIVVQIEDDAGVLIVRHYGTAILIYDDKFAVIPEGAYSNTDRDIINSVLIEIGSDQRACRRGNRVQFRD